MAPIINNRPSLSSPTAGGGASIDKIKYTHAIIIYKGQFRENESNWHEKNDTKISIKIG